MSIIKRKDGNYGYVELDNAPVNAINRSMRQGLLEAVEWAEAEGLERVILSGKGRAFAAGADAREFDNAALDPHLPDVLFRIARSTVPWIACIHGPALGGGAEILLACRYRISRPDAVIGFPEVTLGVVPGAGGTQRLPRLIGPEKALEMVWSGKPVSGAKALELGLVDEVMDDPVEHAEMTNGEWLGMAVAVDELNAGALDDAALDAAHRAADTKMRGQIAPHKAIDLVQTALTTEIGDGLKIERQTFLDLRLTDQARALRHAFFAERGAKPSAAIKAAAPAALDHIAIVGGGTMGAGIAYAALNAGSRVTLLETDADGAERAKQNVEKIITASLKRGLIDDAKAKACRAAITYTTDYAAASDASLAIEAAFEKMEVKQTVFKALETHLNPDAVLATNTSYLDVNEIAAVLSDPARLVGLHFFAPAHIMKLLEIVRGDASSDRALATGYALAKKLRKVPVVAGVCDGFIGNRIYSRYREAADTLLLDHSTPWGVDEAMVGFGYAMGLYETQDLSGLDISYAVRRSQDATRNPNRRYVKIADRMVEEGRLGRKTSVGWYRYPGGEGKVIDPLIEDLIEEEARFAGVTRSEIDADEIQETLMLAMINEACAILDEGIAETAADIDLVTLFGYGFPRWRGGLMHYADTLGPLKVLEGLGALAQKDPLIWTPSQMIRDCATKGISFAEWRRS